MNPKAEWSLPKKIGLSFVSSYIFFYIFPFPLMNIPYNPYDYIKEKITFFIGRNILGIKSLEEVTNTGSGDTIFGYLGLITILLFAIIATILILSFIKKDKRIKKTLTWVHTYSRYYLGLFMLVYGMAKLLENGQFAELSVFNLDKPLGDKSPMGLLWTFMGYSKTYTYFTGLVEVLGGSLLFFRKTKVLGGLICFAAMTNVALLNFCYDVPVKSFSIHLLLISAFIISPYTIPLFRFFFQGKQSQLPRIKINLPKKWMRISKHIFKILAVTGILGLIIFQLFKTPSQKDNLLLNGKNKINSFILNNDTIPPLSTDSLRWDKLLVSNQYGNIAQLIRMNGSIENFKYFELPDIKQIRLKSNSRNSIIHKLSYEQIDSTTFKLIGNFKGDSIEMILINMKKEEYPLISREFRWVQKHPFNK